MAVIYEELRLHRIENELEEDTNTDVSAFFYDYLIRDATQIGTSTNNSIPDELIKYFSFEEYITAVLPATDNNILKIPREMLDKSNYYVSGTTPDTENKLSTDQMWNLALYGTYLPGSTIVLNEKLKDYYEHIQGIDVKDSVIIGTILKTTAELIVKYFTFTTMLYRLMFMKSNEDSSTMLTQLEPDTSIGGTKQRRPLNQKTAYNITPWGRVALTGDSSITLDNNYRYIDSQYTTLESPRSLNTEAGEEWTYFMCNLIDTIYDIEYQLNMRNEVYASIVSENIKLHSTYLSQDVSIQEHEEKFNKEKAYVLTMISKNKRIRELYKVKSFWFMMLLIFLLIYIVAILGLFYVGNNNLFGMQKTLIGNILVFSGSFIILIYVVVNLVRYIF
jgi:hypothetical protein